MRSFLVTNQFRLESSPETSPETSPEASLETSPVILSNRESSLLALIRYQYQSDAEMSEAFCNLRN